MRGTTVWIVCLLSPLILQGEATDVSFGSRSFPIATETECDYSAHVDPKNTGSYLLSKDSTSLKGLSMDILLVHYSDSRCFRAHPIFIQCAQAALSELKNTQKQALVFGGYRTPADIGSSQEEEDLFAAAGTALKLVPMSRDMTELDNIATIFLKHCTVKLERINRNIGVVIEASEVHVFMGGPTDPPVLKLPSSGSLSLSQALIAIDEGLGLGKRSPGSCSQFDRLTTGQMYPEDSTGVEDTVGKMDVAVTRDYAVDFSRLVQYLSSTVQFDNNERSASWCGLPSVPCVDCRTAPVDATLTKRCAARMMTPRMANVLTSLQKLTNQNLGDSVRVLQAWDEDREGYTANAQSIFREGRGLLVSLAYDSSANRVDTLSQLAICAGVDFVEHYGDSLLLAVEKQRGDSAVEVGFPQASLLAVSVPHSMEYLVALPSNFDASDIDLLPIFDSAGKEELEIAPYTTPGMFLSYQTRYFRLNPLIAECFSKIQEYFVKRQDTDGVVTLEVLRGYMATPERDAAFMSSDKRYASPILGESFEFRVDASASSLNVSLPALVRIAVTQCAAILNEANDEDDEDSEENEEELGGMGVGLYADHVFVDMRKPFLCWVDKSSGVVQSASEFVTYINRLHSAALDERIIEPDDPPLAVSLADPPERQSPLYRYKEPERIRLRRQAGTADGECVPNIHTAFCQESEPFRKQLVDEWWAEADKKHNYHDPGETKDAFYKCFNDCGTCTSGSVYFEKLEHCSNYLHWSPFEIAPEGTAVNFFPRDRPELRKCACQSGSHCIENSALFLLIVNVIEAKYRVDSLSDAEQDMYPSTENPNPSAELLNQLYAAHHEGIANVWLNDDTDIAALRPTLEKLMLYNPNVTEVRFYASEGVSSVNSVLRGLAKDWATAASPLYTREYVAPFSVHDLSSACTITSKRAAERHDVRDRLIDKYASRADRLLRFEL